MPTRYTARWVLPVVAAPIEHGALLVSDEGRIVAVGPDDAVPDPPSARAEPLGEAVLLPGLVNAHAHPELTVFRGLLEDLPFPVWIQALMRAKRAARVSADEWQASARWGLVEMLRAGITAVGATEDSGASLDALAELGMRGVVYREVFGPAPEQAIASVAAVRAAIDDMRQGETSRVRAGISPHAPYTVSDALYREVAALARAENLRVAVHAAEAAAEESLVARGEGAFAEGLRRRGIATPPRAASTIELLERTGILDLAPLLIHCVRASTEDVHRIARAGACVAHCPAANARLGHGVAPVVEMMDAGVVVALGTDSMASNNRADLLEEARLAHLLQRAALQSPVALPAATLLRMATLDGARALGIDARAGSLEPGKDADLCAVSLAAPHHAPVHDPVAALFHSARGADVLLTAVAGRVLYRRGAEAPVAGARDEVERIAARLAAALAEGAPATRAAAAT